MGVQDTIASAGRNRHTIIITAREKDGGVETREAEPYSYRIKGHNHLFYCWDIAKGSMRSFIVGNIISVEETGTSYSARFDVEV
jgi:predicted DNA-binding transcriptional regulator YafY